MFIFSTEYVILLAFLSGIIILALGLLHLGKSKVDALYKLCSLCDFSSGLMVEQLPS